MAAEKFGQRMDDDIGAVVDRAQQDRRRHSVVDDERNAAPLADLGQRLDVADVAGWIADALAEDGARIVVDQLFDRLGRIRLGKANRDPLARQEMRKQRVRRAIELRHRHDVGAQVGEIEDRVIERRLTGARAQRFDAALELGDAPLQHRRGRIADAAIAVAFDFQIEQGGAVIGALELVGHRLIDRNRNGARRRLSLVTAMHCDRVAFHSARHAILSLRRTPALSSGA